MFGQSDFENTGLISITDARSVLLTSKKTNLTPFQANILVGYANCDQYGRLKYSEFAPRCQALIGELFSIKSLTEKATIISQTAFKVSEEVDDVGLSKLDLFKELKKFDRNCNGFLDIDEYITCLNKGKA